MRHTTLLASSCFAVALLAQPVTAQQHEGHAGHGLVAGHDAHQDGHGAAGHRMPVHLAMAPAEHMQAIDNIGRHLYTRKTADYAIPDVTLRDQTGAARRLAEVLDHDGPVLLNFIFTSCATICPIMSAVFGQTQEDLAAIAPGYRMVSISIDPEYDTPARLADYARLHEARPEWIFLTGDFEDVFEVVRAFDAIYRANNKMYHVPLTFLRQAGGSAWARLEGLLSAEELAAEYAALTGKAAE